MCATLTKFRPSADPRGLPAGLRNSLRADTYLSPRQRQTDLLCFLVLGLTLLMLGIAVMFLGVALRGDGL